MRRVLTHISSSKVVQKRLVAAIATFVVVMLGLGGGAAYAYFTSSGAGSGTANTGEPLDVHVVITTAVPANTLIPGGTSDLVVRLDNPNAYDVHIEAVTSNGSGPNPGGGCTAGNSGVSVPTQTGLSIAVPPGQHDITIPNGATMSSSSDTSCQGKQLDLPVTLTVQK